MIQVAQASAWGFAEEVEGPLGSQQASQPEVVHSLKHLLRQKEAQ